MREIVLDTETTGLDPKMGHRIVEIGCVELMHRIPTGKVYHVYVNPLREVPKEAEAVHGLKYSFLKQHPVFEAHVDAFLEFIGMDPLVIHNAPFDMKFLNAELQACDRPVLPMDRAIDTLRIAKQKFPGSPASLDALCRRFEVDNSNRKYHGALLDSELLAVVYLELMGGKQPQLLSQQTNGSAIEFMDLNEILKTKVKKEGRVLELSPQEKQAHRAMLDRIKDPIWNRTAS